MEKESDGGSKSKKLVPPLSERETRLILQVIQRDEQLRQRDHFRVMKLKTELQALRRKGALKTATDADGSEGRCCARCRAELGRIINRGALCKACRLRVCKGCREFGNRTTDWVCCVCQKNMELQAATGEWMNEFIRRPSKRRDEKLYVPAADVIKRTIRRSWTISNPAAPRWSEPRNSAEMRAYSSLPRHQDDAEVYAVETEKIDTENLKTPSTSEVSDLGTRRCIVVHSKSKSLNASQESNEEPRDKENEIIRTSSDKKIRYKSQKLKMKIKRQASIEEQFPANTSAFAPVPPEPKEKPSKAQEKKIQFVEDLKIPKIEIMRKDSTDEAFKGIKEYTITSPNSSKLRERFSKSKFLRSDSKTLNVESSKSSDSGLGVSRSTEDESIKTSESGFFKFFDTSSEAKLSKSDSERSPNFLDTVSMFARPRSRERSVSSDSSDKNLSDIDKPSIKIRKRHEYSESRDSSSSVEGNIFDTHISNRVRRLHEVALRQMTQENSKVKNLEKLETNKRSVDFKYPAEFGSYENISKKTQENVKIRKFKSLERTKSKSPTKRSVEFFDSVEIDENGKSTSRLKNQEVSEKRLLFKDKRNSSSRESTLSVDRKKEKRHSRGFLKSRKEVEADESDENLEPRNPESDSKEENLKRSSRKDKRSSKKPKRALSEEKQSDTTRDRGSIFRSMAAGKRRADSENRKDELTVLESSTGPLGHGGSKSASPSPIVGSSASRLRRGPSSVGTPEWSAPDDEIERLVVLDQQRQSNSSLGARSDSMASVYSGAGEGRYCSVPVKGEVEFGLQYNYKAGALEVHIKQCRDLAPVDTKRNRSDPYVKVYLLPDKSKSGKRKTKVKKHTLNPVFDEIFKFHISLSGLETRTLWLTVWHSDMFGRNDFLGEVMMPLENKVFDDPTPQVYTLQERTEPFEDILSYKGEIIIGLKFVPPDANTLQRKGKRSKGTLHVKVKEAKNLTAVKSNGISDPFCKSYLLPDKGRSSKQKTPVQRRTCNPSWNYTFTYDDVSLQELSERCLELTVWDHDRLASNEFLGGLRFNLGTGKHYGKPVDWMDSTGKEVSLWQSMLEKPNLWVEGCLPLRASLDPPNITS